MKKTYFYYATLLILLIGCKSSQYTHLGDGIFADIKTTKGDIILKLEHIKTPVTVANFVSLAEGTNPFVSEQYKEKKYYDGLIFHRVMSDFMIQGGDPTASGSGYPGYRFKDEIVDSLRHDRAGILSMANGGPKTNGSQFFITLKPTPWLDGKHTVFGEVVEGMSVVDSIGNVETGQGDRPGVDVVMNSVEIIRNGKEARNFDAVKIMSDYFAEEEEAIAAMKKMVSDFAQEIATQKESAEALPSGLKMIVLKEGTGEKPKIGQKVMVNYAGYLEDGSMFDSNYEEVARKYERYDEERKLGGGYEPFPMDYSPDARLIPGFKEGLLSMKVGDKIRVFIPPHLGYGQQGSGPIPPNSNLVFDLEITGMFGE
ncbi:MAG: peptidylprolyl isomerase [Muriicola sp.]|nr:peptidylprolyl isomerase [Muriicola sp.]NNC61168.1 peptidylprolyl isomerase [Eudoraea sp.]NNK34405.1 peptidylprolyl isomerase [Eudoraea sp.]